MENGSGTLPNLTKEQILSVDDLARERIEIPEWHGSVLIRELTAYERNKLGVEFMGVDGAVDQSRISPDLFPRIAAAVIIDEQGKRMFSVKDVEALGEKSFEAVNRIVSRALILSGMTEEAAEEGKDDLIEMVDGSSLTV